MGNLIIRRSWNFFASARSYKVIVDGVEIGRLSNNENAVFDINPGKHTLKVGVSLFTGMSQCIDFEINEGETLEYRTQMDSRLFAGMGIASLGFFVVVGQQVSPIGLILGLLLLLVGMSKIMKYSISLLKVRYNDHRVSK